MKYEINKIEDEHGTWECVSLFIDENSTEYFPVDETNPRYIQFQEQLAVEQPEGSV